MVANVSGLDAPCGTCHRLAGDHTLREWAECMGTIAEDLPYQSIPDDVADFANSQLRERFKLDADILIADHVTVRATVLEGETGSVSVRIPALLHDFGIGRPAMPPAQVSKLLYIGGPAGVRSYGRLVRDSANGAAKAAETPR